MRMVVQTKSHNGSNIYYDFLRDGTLIDGLGGNVELGGLARGDGVGTMVGIENKPSDLNNDDTYHERFRG